MSLACAQRQYLSDRYQRQLLTWQTRTIAQFIAATVRVESAGDKSPLMEAALEVSLDPTSGKSAKEKAVSTTTTLRAPVPVAVPAYDPDVILDIEDQPDTWSPGDPIPEAPENANKYEDMMRAMGARG